MNKLNLFTFLLFTISLVHAQNEKITQKLESFTEVKAFDGLSVNLIKSTKNEAIITGANTQKVSIVNNDGVLKLRMEIDKIFSGYRTFVDVYYTDMLTVIDVNEDARISSNETIKQDLLELKSQEGGELIIDAKVTQLLVKSVTGGVITTTGSAKNQDVKINTGGIYYGKGFKTELTTISVNAGGNAEIFATNYVQASVKAGGEVLVYGDPTKMDEKTVFGGKIIRK
ncbi:head GIN domain-containing protein [Cellulophaga fucicola]|uniref:Putative auto-transporter adhesin, head GIN domain n=1 Tax=Cellulophaga fucicola TaxID=76595 RepID=A0A1K1Q8N7_9FLAO|nr:head GIN domain-containing protein [Cellulophaga fucicola]SFW56043.1 Putative auto-transporter adhesin, head GIN domain [Cellulophaga fucicola]